MVLSMVIVTTFKEKVRKVSSEIASVPRDQLKQVESEGDVARASLQLFYIPWDTTRTFRDELFMAIVCSKRPAFTNVLTNWSQGTRSSSSGERGWKREDKEAKTQRI
jgi:hypothetical protein